MNQEIDRWRSKWVDRKKWMDKNILTELWLDEWMKDGWMQIKDGRE